MLIVQKWFWMLSLDKKHRKVVHTVQRHCHTQGGSTENKICANCRTLGVASADLQECLKSDYENTP